jgi:hypothetical protein
MLEGGYFYYGLGKDKYNIGKFFKTKLEFILSLM